jgi:hypothetical protein
MQQRPGLLSEWSAVFTMSEGTGPWVADIAEAAHRIDAGPMNSSLSRSTLLRG